MERDLYAQQVTCVVIGAALEDVHAHSIGPVLLATSNPARMDTSCGGVGRNIAENIARLGMPVSLVALVGPDEAGDRILHETAQAGVDVSLVSTGPEPTGRYLAVMDADGELVVALSDLSGTEHLTPSRVAGAEAAVRDAEVVVIDGNLPSAIVRWALDLAAEGEARVVLDPVSVVKADRLHAVLAEGRPVAVVTPNVDELPALAGGDPDPVAWLHAHGVGTVWTRMGAAGSRLSMPSEAHEIRGHPLRAVDVTGAGDSMTGGFVRALLAGEDEVSAAAYGQAVAELTVISPWTVRPDLTHELVTAHLAQTP